MRIAALAATALALLATAQARATVRLPHIFSDRMILQRDQPVAVWGWAEPGETVVVRVAEQNKPATASADGKWSVTLDPLRVGRALTMTVNGATSTVTVTDVLVGDVFLCSGQSNMAMSLDAAKRHPGVAEDVATADFPRIRFFKTPDLMSKTPEEDVPAVWEPITPRNAAGFSAVAFYFGRGLHAHVGVPIGLIRASHAGGPAEAKMPRAALLTLDIGRRYDDDARRREASWTPERLAAFNSDTLAKWEIAVKDAAARGTKSPAKPKPRASAIDFAYPASDYNAQIAPVICFTQRAVLWYQGEHNAARARAFEYRRLFPRLIESWREASGQPDLPFIFVQLPAFGAAGAGDDWPLIRESQLLTLRTVPHTAMVTAIDTGERDNVHPADKQPIGERLALEARRLLYREGVTGCGPLYDHFTIDGPRIVVHFRHLGGGLRGRDGTSLGGFMVAGADRIFFPATAKIVGDDIVVQHSEIPQPIAVRYAWAGFPAVSLFNPSGVPASPFRTDDWDSTPP